MFLTMKNNTYWYKNFDFNNKTVKNDSDKNKHRINFLDLLIHLWPGDWEQQLEMINKNKRRQL